MAVQFYDKALLQKLNNWTQNTQVKVFSHEDLDHMFSVMADTNNDQPLRLPFIILSRNAGYTILNINKRPLTYDGKRMDANEEKVAQLNAIPITIPYQLDVYTRYRAEADAMVRDIIFNIINHPTLTVTVPYNDLNFTHNATLRIATDVEDNSGIAEHLVADHFVRMTLSLNIDDAYLWSVPIRDVVSIAEEPADIEIITTQLNIKEKVK